MNATKRNFDDIVNVIKVLNLDVQVIEKPFYVELDEAIARDSKRTGNACVGEAVIRKFWKQLGGKQFQFYKARVEVFTKRTTAADRIVEPMAQDEGLPRASFSITMEQFLPYIREEVHMTLQRQILICRSGMSSNV